MNPFNYLARRIDPVRYWKRKGVVFGKNVQVHHSCNFDSEPYLVEIGDNVKISSGVRFVTHDGGVHVFRVLNRKYRNIDLFKGKIIVGKNTFIGNNATILHGAKIGSNCVIGYGSIVTRDIPDNSVACGIPARVIDSLEEYKTKNDKWIFETKHMKPKKKKEYLLSIFK